MKQKPELRKKLLNLKELYISRFYKEPRGLLSLKLISDIDE